MHFEKCRAIHIKIQTSWFPLLVRTSILRQWSLTHAAFNNCYRILKDRVLQIIWPAASLNPWIYNLCSRRNKIATPLFITKPWVTKKPVSMRPSDRVGTGDRWNSNQYSLKVCCSKWSSTEAIFVRNCNWLPNRPNLSVAPCIHCERIFLLGYTLLESSCQRRMPRLALNLSFASKLVNVFFSSIQQWAGTTISGREPPGREPLGNRADALGSRNTPSVALGRLWILWSVRSLRE